jgi:hypothetical protein
MFQLVPTATFCKTLNMAMKWKSLDLNTKLEIIHLCGVSSSSKSEVGMLDGLIS